MGILILTGPPAAGKNTIAPLIARTRTRCAVIDVDQVRWMLVQPHAAPWEGEEGRHQCLLGVENACMLAARFATDGCDVLLLDFLWDYTLPVYRQRLETWQPKIALLLPTLEECLRRNHARGWLPAHEVRMLYAVQSSLQTYDIKLDNSGRTVEDVAATLTALLDAA